MPDRHSLRAPRRAPTTDPLVAAARTFEQAQRTSSSVRDLFGYTDWQEELWAFYDNLGEYAWAVDWLTKALSLVRLTAAEVVTGGDEPAVINEGPAADAIARLGAGVGGHGSILGAATTQLSVPGEGWLVGEADVAGEEVWRIYSASEIRPNRGTYEVQSDTDAWRPLASESFVTRIWEPDPRRYYRATSPGKAALPIMRRIDLLDRRIVATLVSRLAMNGLLLIPQEGTFSAPPQYKDAPDPFVAYLLDIAAKNIKSPGSASASIPLPVKYSKDLIDKWKHLTFGDGITKELLEERDKELRRLATALNVPAEIILGLGDSNHWCVDDQTEILTQDGWRTHDQLHPGDVVLTLNHDAGLSEWQPVGQVKRWEVTDLEMVSIEGRYHSSLTTPNHRWPVLRGSSIDTRQRVFTTSETIGSNDFLLTGARCADVPAQPKYDDAFVELVSWYFTEGTCHRRPGRNTPRVTIYQSQAANPENVERIRSALAALYGPPTDGPLDSGGRRATEVTLRRREREAEMRSAGHTVADIARAVGVSSVQVYKDLRIIDGDLAPRERITAPRWTMKLRSNGMVAFKLNAVAGAPFADLAPDRVVPLHFVQDLTHSQLELFIDAAVRGDGHLMHGKTRLLAQKNPDMLAAYELAAILSGRSVTRRSNDTVGFTKHHQHVASVRDRTVFRPSHSQPSRPGNNFSRKTYSGSIWCPTTPNRTWLARRNGSIYFTGNTAWMLEEAAIKLHVNPMAETICQALTTGYLHPMLDAEGAALRGPNGGLIICWYDTSKLTARPDKTEPAFRAYDRFELSGEALRRETGFGEDDAPDDAELAEQIWKRLAATPILGPTAVTELTRGTPSAPPSETPSGGPTGASDEAPEQDAEPAVGPSDGPSSDERRPPATRDAPPPPPGPDTPAALAAVYITPDLDAPARLPVTTGVGAGSDAAQQNGKHRSNGGRHRRRR